MSSLAFPALRYTLQESDPHSEREDFATAVARGLESDPKSLPCRFFYDAEGSQLFEEICELPVGDIAAPDSHLYLWVPTTRIPDGLKVMEAYQFRFIALLAWIKPSGGLGRYFRYATEYVAFGVKGSLMTRSTNLTNVVHAKRAGHSRKTYTRCASGRASCHSPCRRLHSQ